MAQEQIGISLQFTADTKQAKAELESLQTNLMNLIKTADQTSDDLGLTKDLQKAVSSAAELKAHLTQATNVDTGKLDLHKFNESLKASGKDIQFYQRELLSLGPAGEQAFNEFTQAILKAEIPLKRSSALVDGLKKSLANAVRWQISSSVIHGFMGSIQTAYNYAQDLNESLNKIRIVTGQNTAQMAKFAEQANKSAQALSTTTTRYTDAALIYYQQGLSDKEVQSRTEATIKMSQATGESATDVSSYMTAIWNNFDNGSKSLEYYADVITALGASTASSSAEIARGLKQFAPIAETVGLSYEYATSALATLVATTRQSSDQVGNSLKTIFSRLQGLSLGETLDDGVDLNKYSKALNAVGVTVLDANGGLKDMDTILDDLAERWTQISNAQKMALAQTVAGTRQYNQLISLMDNWNFMQQNIQTANASEGTLTKQAEIYQQSWQAARDRVRAALEEVYSDLIDDKFFITLLDVLKKIVNLTDDFIKGIGGLPGILSAAASILSGMFNKEMAGGINDLIYNLKPQKLKEKEYRQTKEDAVAGARNLANEIFPDSPANKAKIDGLTRQVEITQTLLQYNQQMSETERLQAQYMREQVEQAGNLATQYAEQREELMSTEQIQQKNFIDQAKILFGDDEEFKELEKQFNAARLNYNKKAETGEATQAEIEALDAAYEKIVKRAQDMFNNMVDRIQDITRLSGQSSYTPYKEEVPDPKRQELSEEERIALLPEEAKQALSKLKSSGLIQREINGDEFQRAYEIAFQFGQDEKNPFFQYFDEAERQLTKGVEWGESISISDDSDMVVKYYNAITEREKELEEEYQKAEEQVKQIRQQQPPQAAINFEKLVKEAEAAYSDKLTKKYLLDQSNDTKTQAEASQDEAKNKVDEAQNQVNEASKQANEAQKEVNALTRKIEQLKQQLKNAEDTENKRKQSLEEAENSGKSKSINASQEKLTEAQTRVGEINADLIGKQKALEEAKARQAEADKKLGEAKKNLTNLTAELNDKQKAATVSTQELTKAENAAAEAKRKYNDAQKAVNKEAGRMVQGLQTQNNTSRQTRANISQTSEALNEQAERAEKAKNKLIELAESAKGDPMKAGEFLTNTFRGVSSLATVINTGKGLWNAWTNDSVSFGEALSSTLTSLTFVVPQVLNTLKVFREEKMRNYTTDLLLKSGIQEYKMSVEEAAASLLASTTATEAATAKKGYENLMLLTGNELNKKATEIVGAKAAAEAFGITITDDMTAAQLRQAISEAVLNKQKAAGLKLDIARLGVYALLAVAIIGAGVAIKALIDIHNADAIAAEKAAKANEELKKKVSDAKQELNSIEQAFEGYDKAVDALNRCVKGTQAWYEALRNVNNEILQIIANNPDLAGKLQFETDKNGVRTITQESRDEVIQEAQNRVDAAVRAQAMGSAVAQQAQYRSDLTDARRQYSNFLPNYESIYWLSQPQKILDDWANREEILRKQYGKTDEEIAEFLKTLQKLADEANSADTALEQTANLIAEQELGNNASEAVKEMASEIYETAFQKAYDNALDAGKNDINVFSGKGDKEVKEFWRRYSEATHTNFQLASNAVRGTDGNRSFAYLDNGVEKTISLEEAAAAIAAAEALEALGKSANEASTFLSNLKNNGGDNAEDIEKWIAGGNFENSSQARIEAMKDAVEEDATGEKLIKQVDTVFGGQLEEYAKIMGITSLEAAQRFQKSLYAIDFDSVGENLTKTARTAFNNIRENNSDFLKGLNVLQQQEFADAVQQIFNKGGSEGLGWLQSILDGLSAEEAQKFASGLKNIDWEDADFDSIANSLGITKNSLNDVKGPLENFIELMKQIYGIANGEVPDESTASDRYNELQSVYDKVSKGTLEFSLDSKEWGIISQYGDKLTQFFIAGLDGSMILLSTAKDEFLREVENLSVEGYDALIEHNSQVIKGLEELGSIDPEEIVKTYFGGNTPNTSGAPQAEPVLENPMSDWGIPQVEPSPEVTDNSEIVEKQLQILSLMGDQEAQGWQMEYAENGKLDSEIYIQIAERVKNLIDEYGSWENLLNSLNGNLERTQTGMALQAKTTSELSEIQGQYHLTTEQMGIGLVHIADQYEELEYALDEYSKEMEEANKFAEGSTKRTEAIAKAQQKLWAAIRRQEWAKLTKDIGKYVSTLATAEKGSDDYMQAASKIAKGFNEVFDTDITAEWVAENEKLFQQWANAPEDLKNDYAEMILDIMNLSKVANENGDIEITVSKNGVDEELKTLSSAYDNLKSIIEQNPIQVDANGKADMSNLINALLDAGYTAEEVAGIMRALGQTEVYVRGVGTDEGEEFTYYDLTTPGGLQEYAQYLANTNGQLGVTGRVPANSNFGGSGTNVAMQDVNTSKSGGGGGGGKSASHAEKKSDKDKERYHTIQNQLEDLNSEYDEISKAKDRAFGTDRLDAMDAEIAKTDELIEAQEKYLDEISKYDAIDTVALEQSIEELFGKGKGPVIEYDARGNIANFDEIQDAMYNLYNTNTDKYTEDDEAWKKFEKRYEYAEDMINQYEETYDLLRDEETNLQNLLDQRADEVLEKAKYEIELKMDITEDSLNLLEYELEKLDNKAFTAAEAIQLLGDKADTLYSQMMIDREGLDKILGQQLSDAEIKMFYDGDMSVLDNKHFTEEQMNTIKEYRDNLLDLNKSLEEVRQNVQEKLSEAFDEFNEELEKGVNTIDHYETILENYKNIIDIVGKRGLGVSDKMLKQLNDTINKNNIDQIKASKAQYDAVEAARKDIENKLNDAIQRNDSDDIEYWKSQLDDMTAAAQEAQEELMQDWEDALSSIADQFEEAVQLAVDQFNEAIYGLRGLEGLSEDFAHEQEMADNFLDDYEKIYELSKLNRQINNSIDDTKNIAGKQKLKALQDKLNDAAEDGVQLSKYDLEYLQKEYDLRMAEIALEDARNAKNTVRLTKDNEGNWSYAYTQNTDAVNDAQQKYEDALYAMQDLSSNYINEMEEKLIDTSKEMQEALAEIRIEDYASIDDYYREVKRVQDQYQEELDMQQAELQKAIDNNKSLYDEDWTNYHNATGYKISDTEDFVTNFRDSLLGDLLGAQSNVANFTTDYLAGATDMLIQNLMQNADGYYQYVDEVNKTAGSSLQGFGDDLKEVTEQIAQDSQEAADSIKLMAEDMGAYLGDVIDDIDNWQQTYGDAADSVITKNESLIKSFNELAESLSLIDGVDVHIDLTSQTDNSDIARFDTGGYTGAWGSYGKLAVLDEKEMVLEQNDTNNMLKAIGLLDSIINTVDLNAYQASTGFGSFLAAATIKDNKESSTLQQDVHITAEFPNVSDHNEVELALRNLVNTASQYANRN